MVRLPVSQLEVELQPPAGADDLLLVEAPRLDIELAIELAKRLTRSPSGGLSIGQLPIYDLDAFYLLLRRMCFGDVIRTEAVCPARQCGKPFDISFGIGEYLAHHRPKRPTGLTAIEEPGWYRLVGAPATFRPPSAADLMAVNGSENVEQQLIDRCMRPRGQRSVVIKRIQQAMASMAPNLCQELQATCPECQTSISLRFDPATYTMIELRAEAISIHEDVHTLASAYHWPEADILALPRARRARYVEMAVEQRRPA